MLYHLYPASPAAIIEHAGGAGVGPRGGVEMRSGTTMLPRLISRAVLPAVCLTLLLGIASAGPCLPQLPGRIGRRHLAGRSRAGLYYSILFMMSMPFAIFGTFAGFMYRAVKREQRRVADADQSRNTTGDRS